MNSAALTVVRWSGTSTRCSQSIPPPSGWFSMNFRFSGLRSELAARASVAAARQGKQQELRRRFMRTPLVAEEASVLRVAADIGLDVDRLARDMASPEVQADLDRTRALADIFGFVGTPGLVIGRTVLNGAIPYALLRRIAEDEKSMTVTGMLTP